MAIKRNEVLIHAIMWINLKNMLVKGARYKRSLSVWFHLYEISRRGISRETEHRLVSFRSWRKADWGELPNGYGVSDENVWEPDRGGGCTQNCECTNHHLIVHFKMVILCEFHLEKNLKCGGKKREKNPKADLCVPGTHPRHRSHFHFIVPSWADLCAHFQCQGSQLA